MMRDGVARAGFDLEPKTRSEAQGAQQAEVVFFKAGIGLADGPEELVLQIVLPADVVDDLVSDGIEKEPVDRKIPAFGVFFGGGEAHFRRAPAIQVFSIASEGGDLD